MDLRNAVSTAFGIETPAMLAFDYPTAAGLAAFIAEHIASAAAAQPAREELAQHGLFGNESWPAAPTGVRSDSRSAPQQDPAPGPSFVGNDPQRLTDEISAVVAEALGRPVAADVPLMEVCCGACQCCLDVGQGAGPSSGAEAIIFASAVARSLFLQDCLSGSDIHISMPDQQRRFAVLLSVLIRSCLSRCWPSEHGPSSHDRPVLGLSSLQLAPCLHTRGISRNAAYTCL